MKRGESKRSPGSDLDSVKSVLKLLSNNLRMSMIVNLAAKPMNVASIAKMMGFPQSTVRGNLKKLVDADLLKVDQEKSKRIYTLGDTISVQKQRSKVLLEVDIPGGGSVAMKMKWPVGKD